MFGTLDKIDNPNIEYVVWIESHFLINIKQFIREVMLNFFYLLGKILNDLKFI